MFDFLKKVPKNSFAEQLKVDFHSHLIPGIDDGSPDLETSIRFLKTLREMGYMKIITTPHVMTDLYPNTSKNIKEGLALLQSEIQAQNIDLIVEASAEYYLDSSFEKLLGEENLLTFGHRKHILIEFSFVAPIPNFKDILFNIQTKGYTPILAHPERYNYWHDNTRLFSSFKEMDLLMQVNIPSLLGYYGKPIKNWAIKLIKSGNIDFIATDLHHDRHLQLLKSQNYSAEINQLIKDYDFKNSTLL